MDLKEWLANYLKWKDQVDHALKDVKVEKDVLTAAYEDKKVSFLLADKLTDETVKHLAEGKFKGVCTKNIEDNFSFLITRWDALAAIPNLMMIFVNLELGEKWILFPSTHNMIADKETLKQGLRTMFDLANGKVPEIKVDKKKAMFEEVPEDDE
jgi:hypothetical protein